MEIFSFEMDLIPQYRGSSSEDEIPDKELNVRQIRQVYLVTYSQADLSKFPDRDHLVKQLRRLRSDLLNPKFGNQKSALL